VLLDQRAQLGHLDPEWLDEHIEPDALRWCNGVAVEHRYLDDIVHGMINGGLEVS
jgi:hypothetical protein